MAIYIERKFVSLSWEPKRKKYLELLRKSPLSQRTDSLLLRSEDFKKWGIK